MKYSFANRSFAAWSFAQGSYRGNPVAPTQCSAYGTYLMEIRFGGLLVGQEIFSLQTSFKRATDISIHQNLWADHVILDGAYPALIWSHKFLVYHESDWVYSEISAWLQLSGQITALPQSLKLYAGDTLVIDFGECYLQQPQYKEPDNVLLGAAGIWELEFLGSTMPAVQ